MIMCVSCSKGINKTDETDITKTTEKTEVQDIFETDIFADIPASALSITEDCKITEFSSADMSGADMSGSAEKNDIQAVFSGIYDSAVIAESDSFVLRYTVHEGVYKIRYAAFYNKTSVSEKWSKYIGKTPYDVLVEFGTPFEIKDSTPAVMLYKKDIWTQGEGLETAWIQYEYTNKTIHKVSVWKQR